MKLIQPDTARAALAAGRLLGGMDELCTYAYDVCRRSISTENIAQWLTFINDPSNSVDGSATPDRLDSIFGHYAAMLRSDVFNFLTITLPNILQADSLPGTGGSASINGRDKLLDIFSEVPFSLFKSVVESPTFQIGSVIC